MAYADHILTGCLREYKLDWHRAPHDPEVWWRHVEKFGPQLQWHIIICFTYDQAMGLHDPSVKHLELDLSFKMIQGETNVFSIQSYNKQARRKSLDTCSAHAQQKRNSS